MVTELLANKAVELQYIDSISHEAVSRLFKKTSSNLTFVNAGAYRHNKYSFCGLYGGYIGLISTPLDELSPVICMDEKPLQLLDESRTPIPMKPGNPERQDGEYVRNGTCSIFLFTEPLAGWRHVTACQRRTRIDWANQIRDLLEIYYPKSQKYGW